MKSSWRFIVPFDKLFNLPAFIVFSFHWRWDWTGMEIKKQHGLFINAKGKITLSSYILRKLPHMPLKRLNSKFSRSVLKIRFKNFVCHPLFLNSFNQTWKSQPKRTKKRKNPNLSTNDSDSDLEFELRFVLWMLFWIHLHLCITRSVLKWMIGWSNVFCSSC